MADKTNGDAISVENYHIPNGLDKLLHEFAVSVLIDRPESDALVDYAAKYFTDLSKRSGKFSESKTSTVPMYIIVDSDEEAGEPDYVRRLTNRHQSSKGRRKSVSAEKYNPESSSDEEQDVIMTVKTDDEHTLLRDRTKSILLFRMLDDDHITTVINAMIRKPVQPDEAIIQQGDDGDYFYVIENGVYDFFITNDEVKDKKVNTIRDSGSFGELALMYSQPRSATCIAQTHGVLWALDRKSFKRIVTKEAFKARMKFEKLLGQVPFLAPLSDDERSSVVDGLNTKIFYPGENIIRFGDEGDGMYFIEQGDCSVKLPKGDIEVEVTNLKSGQYFGELALLDNSKRTASVYANTKVKSAFLGREAFERLLGPCCDIMKRSTAHYQMK